MLLSLLQLILFLPIVLLLFTLPGTALIYRPTRHWSIWQQLAIGTVIGLVGFSLLAYLGFIIHLGWVLFIVIGLIDFWLVKQLSQHPWPKPQLNHSQLWLFSITLILGVIGQLAVIAPSGWNYGSGLVFWSSHGHDAAWHISLMNEFIHGWPFHNPSLVGERLINYHFFSDLAPAWLMHYLKFDPFELYFRLMPLLQSILYGLAAYWAARRLHDTFSTGLWSMILAYTAGSFGFLITLPRSGHLNGETIFGVSQLQSSIGNPPQIWSLIILLTIVIFLVEYLKKPNRLIFGSLVLLAATSLVFKVYAGIIIIGSLAVIALWQIIRQRQFSLLLLFITSSLFGALLYLPNTANSTGFLIWQPWYFIRTMVVGTDRLDWLDLELRRQTYLSEHNYKRVLQLELQAFVIYWFGNSGVRLLGFGSLIRGWKKLFNDYLWLYLVTILVSGFIFPLVLLQKGVAGNAIQFMQYYLLALSLFAAVSISQLLNKLPKYIGLALALLIITLAIPTQIGLFQSFYSRAPFSQITNAELTALQQFKSTPANSVILTAPYDQYARLPDGPTPPIWGWFDTAYVAAMTDRSVYFADREQVDIMGYDYQSRYDLVKAIFNEPDPTKFQQLLAQTPANYLYFPKQLAPITDLNQTNLTQVFQNNEIEIWQVN